LALAIDLSRHWFNNVQHLREGRRWFERLLERDDPKGNIQFRAWALSEASWLAARSGDWERGLALAEGCLALARQSETRLQTGVALTTLAIHTWTSGQVDRARALQEEGLEIVRQFGDQVINAIALQNLGAWTAYGGKYDQALPLLWESVALWRVVGDMRCLAFPLRHLGIVACRQGDLESARTLLCDGLGPSGSTGDQIQVVEYLEEFAVLAVHTGENDRAVRLWGAAGALLDLAGLPLDWAVQERHDRYQPMTRAHVTEARWNELSAEGASMTLEQAIGYALEDPGYRLPAPSHELLDTDIQSDDCDPVIAL
jgi:non-specific serine/threonine protein kinase